MPKNATIYIADPSMMGSRLFERVKARSYEGLSSGGNATGVRFQFPWGKLTMNFMPTEQIAQHLVGFEGYARHVIKDRDRLIHTLARIRCVRLPIGCVIEHREADEQGVQGVLFDFNGALNGLLFLHDTIFDFDGEALGGPLAKPS